MERLGYVSVLLTKTYMNIEYDVSTQYLISIHIPQNHMSSSLEQNNMLFVSLYTYIYEYYIVSIYIYYIYESSLYSSDSAQRRLHSQHLGDGMLILSMTGGEISKGHDGSALMRAAGGAAAGYKVSNGLGCSYIKDKI